MHKYNDIRNCIIWIVALFLFYQFVYFENGNKNLQLIVKALNLESTADFFKSSDNVFFLGCFLSPFMPNLESSIRNLINLINNKLINNKKQ